MYHHKLPHLPGPSQEPQYTFPILKFYDWRNLAQSRECPLCFLSRNHTDDLDLRAQPITRTILREHKGHIPLCHKVKLSLTSLLLYLHSGPGF